MDKLFIGIIKLTFTKTTVYILLYFFNDSSCSFTGYVNKCYILIVRQEHSNYLNIFVN